MNRSNRTRSVSTVLIALAAVATVAGLAPAAALAADAAPADADLVLVVQMPLAVARVAEIGYPEDDLEWLAASLIEAAVAPSDFIDIVRLAPVEWRLVEVTPFYAGDAEPDYDLARRIRESERDRWVFVDRPEAIGPGLGAYVQARLAEGVRGPALTTAIHKELRRRGVPAGPKRWARPAEREFVTRIFDTQRLRENQERRATGWLPPAQAKRLAKGRALPPGQAKKEPGEPANASSPGDRKAGKPAKSAKRHDDPSEPGKKAKKPKKAKKGEDGNGKPGKPGKPEKDHGPKDHAKRHGGNGR